MKFKILLILVALSILLTSCEVTETTAFQPKIVLTSYAYTDSTLDSVYISRNAKVEEVINFKKLALSNASVNFYEDGLLVGKLSEYSNRKGIYFLPDSINFKFKIGKKYKLTASYPGYTTVSAETTAPDTLRSLKAKIMPDSSTMNLAGKIDTIEYVPGSSFVDNTYFEGYFDKTNMSGKKLAIYEVIPENKGKSFWLEDTTKAVWEDYAKSVQFFRDKEQYGKNFYYWFNEILYINWMAFYSKGLNFIRLGSMDEVRRNYLVNSNDPDAEHTGNVINGSGIFTITSYNKKVYKVFVKDNIPNPKD